MAGHGGREFWWGPDPCALGRRPEGNAPHLYRQVQGGATQPIYRTGTLPGIQ